MLADGQRLFHSSHGNLKSSGGAVPATNLGAAMLAMRKQTGISGRLIGVNPTVVLAPAALEAGLLQFFGQYAPAKSSDVNPWRDLRVIIDPRLDAKSTTRWYLIAEGIEGLVAREPRGQRRAGCRDARRLRGRRHADQGAP